MSATAPAPAADERLAPASVLRKLLGRPELGAVVGAAAVFVFFSFAAPSFLQASSSARSCTRPPPSGSWRPRWPC